MFSRSSLDQTPWRSGSPHGVRGALYSTALPPIAVTTSAGGVLRDWPRSAVPPSEHAATIPTTVLNEAISRLLMTVAFSWEDGIRRAKTRADPGDFTSAAARP